ncbi:hypothetical protein GBZ86_11130 [Clostridium tarantellae]|uniref:Mannosyl-glycoprotein endo-beta-N-acetylglucosamidase-like domain-containing protein n=1 Tax=Clostridium tarantellae TaxID=39493 RepID=A0A6I1MQ07_9CLOT|nr:hypothetical protein [Clostridium tarantellae]
MKILDEEKGFYKFKFKDGIGYASSKYIKIIKGEIGLDEDDKIQNDHVKYVSTNYYSSLQEYIRLQMDANPTRYTYEEFEQYINPQYSNNQFQFLRLDKFRTVDLQGTDHILKGKGILNGQASGFINAAKKYNIDPLFLVCQSLHETGNGTSKLAKGVIIKEIADENKPKYNSSGDLIGYEMIPLKKPVTVYNLFGIGAKDNLPNFPNRALILGTTYAYKKGWTNVPNAIEGAAEFLAKNYVHSSKYNQNTLYKMRYNQDTVYMWHQYATTPWYAESIGTMMKQYRYIYTGGEFLFDTPVFIDYKLKSFLKLPQQIDKNKLSSNEVHVSVDEKNK